MASDPSVALQDSNVLCLNHKDLSGTAVVLPVRGYGEEDEQAHHTDEKLVDDGLMDASATVRGARTWRDVTGGATVCCSHCSAPLGFAAIESPESFRLLKHRLSVPNGSPNHGPSSQRLISCVSFLAREMVRYAEAKAIFTFIVALDTPKMNFASSVFEKCILLRLVSWDCNIATRFEESSRRLAFGRYAKIVFEETYDRKASPSAAADGGPWMWGGVDLCCPQPVLASKKIEVSSGETEMPSKAKEHSISTARILLQEDEYSETLESLREGQKLFTKDVFEATVLVKMGVMSSSTTDNGLGLTAIAL